MGGEWNSQNGVPAARSSQGKRKVPDFILSACRRKQSHVIHTRHFVLSPFAPLNYRIASKRKQFKHLLTTEGVHSGFIFCHTPFLVVKHVPIDLCFWKRITFIELGILGKVDLKIGLLVTTLLHKCRTHWHSQWWALVDNKLPITFISDIAYCVVEHSQYPKVSQRPTS